MSPVISKHCFPDSSKCHNCERKFSKVFTATDPKENTKRCSSYHLMTYCDKDCQREHWLKVHKKHCRFLSGKSPVKNSNHDAATCARCIQARKASRTQILNENSPMTRCNIEAVNESMKKALSSAFGFHGEAKKCNCLQKFGLQLPFPLGEISGQYLEIAGTGLDPMLAHVVKILDTMITKVENVEHKKALGKTLGCIMTKRSQLWYDIIICGKPQIRYIKNLSEQLETIQTIFGASNPWWKILRFSVAIVTDTICCYESNFHDSRILDDPRFQKVKLLNDYRQSQLQNQVMVWEKKMWPNFMLWPQLVDGSLAVLLPPGSRCQSCSAHLSGEVTTPLELEEVNHQTRPILLPNVGDNGTLVTCCSVALKPSCVRDILSKDLLTQMKSDGNKWKEYLTERDRFLIEARDCDFCLKISLSSHRCSACLCVQYCSLACQKEDLDFHNSVCSKWSKDESRKIVDRKSQKQHWKKEVTEK